MSISAKLVKELRERTGAGMMECKRALVETDGDLDAAGDLLRKSGQAKADKKAGRVAAEGRVVVSNDGARYVIVEVNSETDFVAKDDNFVEFAQQVAATALSGGAADLGGLLASDAGGITIDQARTALIAKVGENIGVRRFEILQTEGPVGEYVHGSRIGVVVELDGGDETLARDIAMHVAASNPSFVAPADVPGEVLEKEKEILSAQAEQEGKPANIVEKMVEGRLRKYLAEITLLGQPFVKDPDMTVGQLLKNAGAGVIRFVRYEVGEGIEKKVDNFVEEVMAQVSQSR
jgi:elongation factor Ts